MNKLKKCLSLCMSIAVTASAIPMNSLALELPVTDETDCPVSDELFSSIVLDSGTDQLIADNKEVGNSYGGFTLNDDSTVTVNIDGATVPFEEASRLIGCEMMHQEDGSSIITSPFQSSRLIVRSENDFDRLNAVSCEERFTNHFLLTFASPSEAYQAYLKLSQDGCIDYVEPDSVCAVSGSSETDDYENDIDSWGVKEIGANDYCSWLKNEKAELPEIKVAVIDTGIYSGHSEFRGRILEGGKSFVQGDDGIPDDQNGHGSHCAGIICSSTNDNVKILPVQVLSEEGTGSTMDVYCGMMYAIEQDADVISMSLGGYGKSNLFDEAVAAAKEKGIVLCVAAGNEHKDSIAYYSSLSSNEDAVVVSSVNSKLEISDFSNYGAVDFAAPGEYINSAGITGSDSETALSGTSMATPFVAACFADVFSYDTAITADDAYEYIKANAVDICETGFDSKSGWGFVNLRNFHFSTQRVEIPEASVSGGSFTDAFDVELSCRTDDALIYYTTDGSEPSPQNGTLYDGTPIHIERSARLSFCAVLDDIVSRSDSEYYIVCDVESPEAFVIRNNVLTSYNGSMKSLDLAEMVENGSLPSFTSVGDRAFADNETLEEIILPDSVTTIGTEAFSNCINLKTVVSQVSEIQDAAFSYCENMTSFTSKNVRNVAKKAFYFCESLKDFYGRSLTVINDAAFSHCTSLDSDSFDFPKITHLYYAAFCGAGLTGKVDISNAQFIGEDVFFSADKIEEIIFPPELEELPYDILKGCSSIKKISAPSVTVLNSGSLALMKEEFSEDTMVETDIDFSKVTYIGGLTFLGYVFDRPVSFDSLNNDKYLFSINCFSQAFGESVSLPNLSDIYCGGVSRTSTMESDDTNINVLYFDNAERSDDHVFNRCNAVVVGDSTILNGTPIKQEGKIYRMSDVPQIYAPADSYECHVGDELSIKAVSVGREYTAAWYKNENGTETKLDTSYIFPLKADTSSAGEQVYIYRQFDADGNEVNSKEITVNVLDYNNGYEIYPVNLYDFIIPDFTPVKVNSDKLKFIGYSFTPDESGDYKVNFSQETVTVKNGDEITASLGNGSLLEKTVYLEAGIKYTFEVSTDEYDFLYFNPYFSIRPASDTRKCITSLRSSLNIPVCDYYDGNGPFVAKAKLKDGNTPLTEGVDFEVEPINDPLLFKANTIYIKGIGNYFGTLRGTAYCSVPFTFDRYFPVNVVSVKITPDEDAVYKLIEKPGDAVLQECIDNSEMLYLPHCISHLKLFDGTEWITLDSTENNNDLNCLSSNKYSTALAYEMKAGNTYSLNSTENVLKKGVEGYDMEMLITSGTILDECSIEYDLNCEFNGTPVTPNVSITAPDGTVLQKDKDFIVVSWNNTEPGIMYSYILGIGDYQGFIPFVTALGNCGATLSKDNTDLIADISLNHKISFLPDLTYRIEVENDTVIHLDDTTSDETVSLNFLDENDEIIASVNSLNDYCCALPKGIYTFYSSSNYAYSGTLAEVNDSISVYSVEADVKPLIFTGSGLTPELSLSYNGETLTEDVDYITFCDNEIKNVGLYKINIMGINRFKGLRTLDCIVLSGEDPSELINGQNLIDTPSASMTPYTWTPESDSYILSTNASGIISFIVYDEDGNCVVNEYVSRKISPAITVTPDKQYTAYILTTSGEFCKLSLSHSGRLFDCDIQYDPDVPLSDKDKIHKVTFIDGDYTLVEGVDYVCSSKGDAFDTGRCEYVFDGCGNYFGSVIIPFVIYEPELTDTSCFNAVCLNLMTRVWDNENEFGKKSFFRFTSTAEGTAHYTINALDAIGAVSDYISVAIYDTNGKFIGTNHDFTDISLENGETVYLAASLPYVMDSDDAYWANYSSYIQIVKAENSKLNGILGDVNNDGCVNPVDATLILRQYTEAAAGGDSLSDDEKLRADVNGDGVINPVDATFALSYYTYKASGGELTIEQFIKK